jgi:Rrf2 family protein
MELVKAQTLKEPLTISAIAARQTIPERYLEHIFTLLRKGGIVQSQRGAKGGYVLSIEPWKLTILEVVNLMDGTSRDLPNSRNRSSLEARQSHSIERDLVSEVFQQTTDVSQNVLRRYTLQDLSYRRDDRKQKNLMYYI